MDISSLAKSEFPAFKGLNNLYELFILQLTKDFNSANFDTSFVSKLKADIQEIQFAIIEQLEREEINSKFKLSNLLYRIDISELQINKLCKEKPDKNLNEILSELIIKRVLQKVVFKEFYKAKAK